MNDPKRLRDDPEDEMERLLLGAGRRTAPRGAKQRALLVATGAAAASSLAAAGAAAEGTAGLAKVGGLAAIKWIGVLGVSGVTAMAGAMAVEHGVPLLPRIAVSAPPSAAGPARPGAHPPPRRTPQGEPDRIPDPGPLAAPALPEPDPGRASASAPEAQSAADPAVSNPPAARPGPRHASAHALERKDEPASTTRAELALLDGARRAMLAGAPGQALSMLEGYERRFPRGSMAPEAAVLRIEALLARGDRGAALQQGQTFLAADPQSPYAARVRSLLAGAPIP